MADKTNPDFAELISAAQAAAESAYVPYSKVAKGAALVCDDGQLFTGACVEFATYGGTVCAELAALTKALNAGKRNFRALALFPAFYPCGSCRQFFREFGLELDVVVETGGRIEMRSLIELLPNSFGPEYL